MQGEAMNLPLCLQRYTVHAESRCDDEAHACVATIKPDPNGGLVRIEDLECYTWRSLRLVTLEEYLDANDNRRDVLPELRAAIESLEGTGGRRA